MSVDRLVARALTAAGADQSTRELWLQIVQAFDNGGPNDVKQLIQGKVRESRRQADKEARSVRSIAGTVVKPKHTAPRPRS